MARLDGHYVGTHEMQKLCKTALAASLVWKPSSWCGRSRSNLKAWCNLVKTVSTI